LSPIVLGSKDGVKGGDTDTYCSDIVCPISAIRLAMVYFRVGWAGAEGDIDGAGDGMVMPFDAVAQSAENDHWQDLLLIVHFVLVHIMIER